MPTKPNVAKVLELLKAKTNTKDLGKTFNGANVYLMEDKQSPSDSNVLFALHEDEKLTLVNIFEGAVTTINKWTNSPWWKSIVDNPIPYNISQLGNIILSCFVSNIDFDKKTNARKFNPLDGFQPDKGRFILPDFCLTIFTSQVTIDLDRHNLKLVGTYNRDENITGDLDNKISWTMKDKHLINEWSPYVD